jgi:transcription-repair coupling factor (superfamily II helicase)
VNTARPVYKFISMIMDISAAPQFVKMAKELKGRGLAQAVIMETARALVISNLFNKLSSNLAVVTSNPQRALKLAEEINFWLGREVCIVLPESESLVYQRLPENRLNSQDRVAGLARLGFHSQASDEPQIVIFTARALAYKTLDPGRFNDSWFNIKQGQQIDPVEIVRYLQKSGYVLEYTVGAPGEISRRGGILDVFPVGSKTPFRIDFFGDEVDEIREFDLYTQRSTANVEEINIPPATETGAWISTSSDEIGSRLNALDLANISDDLQGEISNDFTRLGSGQYFPHAQFYSPLLFDESILDYFPASTTLIFDDADSVQWAVSALAAEDAKTREAYISEGMVPKGMPSPYYNWQEIEERINRTPALWIYSWEPEGNGKVLKFPFKPVDKYGGSYNRFRAEIANLEKAGKKVLVVSHQAERINEILHEAGIGSLLADNNLQTFPQGSVLLLRGVLEGGWNLNGEIYLFTDAEILGFTRQSRQSSKKSIKRPLAIEQISPGDFVVHVDHGIARFGGITRMGNGHMPREFLVLEYDEQDRLYVPVDQIDRVSRYIGSSEAPPTLSRLGTAHWKNAREKAEKAAQEVAAELLLLYSQREVVEGFSYSEDSVWQKELEASFPYMETPDQLSALTSIKDDLSKSRPMDRLLLGDVGYGKTEVAIRTAFKAVQDNRQVAMLVPTTLLAQQHYITFSQRLGTYPVVIESLSRFKTAAEQKEIIGRIKDGSVDIIIGTHRLLQKDVKFKNLGLIIIDEEQKFGVEHKENLKKKRTEVDVLAMSATPIPRTLYMSLTGARDMSTIETPPEDRLPVHSIVARFTPQLIREAIMRELERNGQVFFVHNRVRSIDEISRKIKEIVPEARFDVAHGQMDEEQLARVMTDFTSGKIDVLVCTTIIESGLDVPNANTLIVNRADKFGLIQLHQLRGRIGRGATSAYAYFVYDDEKNLTEQGRRRLQTIYELAELGSGFNIAMKDLEIRGAGTLLGTRQSGHIAAVGFNMYTELLKNAVEEEKARLAGRTVRSEKQLPEPVIDIPLEMMIPEYYVQNEAERMQLYRRLAGINDLKNLRSFSAELADRFGLIPEETANLIYGVSLKLMARSSGVASIITEGDKLIILPYEGLRFDLSGNAATRKDGVRYSPYRIQLDFKKLGPVWREELESILAERIFILGDRFVNGA